MVAVMKLELIYSSRDIFCDESSSTFEPHILQYFIAVAPPVISIYDVFVCPFFPFSAFLSVWCIRSLYLHVNVSVMPAIPFIFFIFRVTRHGCWSISQVPPLLCWMPWLVVGVESFSVHCYGYPYRKLNLFCPLLWLFIEKVECFLCMLCVFIEKAESFMCTVMVIHTESCGKLSVVFSVHCYGYS